MHEMGVAQQMINIALSSIPKDIVNPKVEKLNLKIGRLAAVVEDSLRFCFDIIAKDSPLEGAELVVEHVAVKVRCKSCDKTWEVDDPIFSCSSCKDGAVEIISGRELEIISIELAE
ncbi:MAG: hydrogenase maturation nickel metallochaperone HypA [Desulfamplus sp.]|nr:hydrogenase maturation nickel metallochaperone HypA [Desulfamplus sp.]